VKVSVLVCDTYHGNVDETDPEAEKVEKVFLSRDEVRRSRVRATTEEGREVGVAVDRRLRDGDIVHDDEIAVVVALEPVEAFKVELGDLAPEQAASLGHELGNAHHEMAVEDGDAYIPANSETREVLEELPDEASFETVEVEPSVFDSDEGGGSGHVYPGQDGHEHSHENPDSGGG